MTGLVATAPPEGPGPSASSGPRSSAAATPATTTPPPTADPGRSGIAMLVATRGNGALVHARFADLARHLLPGDLLVVNTSATLAAALPGRLEGREVELRLSTPAQEGTWVVELRTQELRPLPRPPIGARVLLPAGGHAELLSRHADSERLCVARLRLATPLGSYLRRHGHPIRYAHAERAQPLEAHQTVFALDPGSAEMPSAGRPFTTALVTELVARGVLVAPVTLHAGVSSLEHGEPPYAERYRVPATTAWLVGAVRGHGGRVIAVGTTVVRALETVAARDGTVRPGQGRTSLVVTPERGLRAVDGLLTGWHEPQSSHLSLLEAAAGADLLERSYRAARAHGLRWHEFGDSHLILP
ncbi:MAG TPA: S-adenosylmethionine:tRNA ribosyltransferase-isomerase [Solirubrobacteraceae bacterium]|nr:S-adenosylmethionine:tRNA ribosyltransferase-isomerase [Solirubrobacteraceae bacterium]